MLIHYWKWLYKLPGSPLIIDLPVAEVRNCKQLGKHVEWRVTTTKFKCLVNNILEFFGYKTRINIII